MNPLTLDIRLVDGKQPTSATTLDYAPYGVKTLKLQIRKLAGPAQKIWLRAQRFQRDTDPGAVYGLADDSADLWVVWGAGDVVGVCAKYAEHAGNKKAVALDDAEPHTVYLHLFHRPTAPTPLRDYALTVVAVTVQEGALVVVAERTFQLTVPTGLTAPARFVWEGGPEVSRLVLTGTETPAYNSRWWPTRTLQYQAEPALPQLSLEYIRAVAGGPEGHITVWLEKETGRERLAEIAGHLTWPLHDLRWVQPELYRFYEDGLWALRLWFFWVDENIDGADLLTYVPVAEQAALRAQRAQEAAQLMQPQLLGLWPGWAQQYEIPDIERFDIVFNPADLSAKYGCTDAHWQEFWFAVHDPAPCQCHLAAPQEAIKVVLDFMRQHFERWGEPAPAPITNPLADRGLVALITANLTLNRSFLSFDLASDLSKAPGFLGKNAPRVKNSQLLDHGFSSDVLAG